MGDEAGGSGVVSVPAGTYAHFIEQEAGPQQGSVFVVVGPEVRDLIWRRKEGERG